MPVSCLAYCRDRDLEWLSPGAMWRGGAVSKLKMRYQSACRRGMSGWSQPLCGAGGGVPSRGRSLCWQRAGLRAAVGLGGPEGQEGEMLLQAAHTARERRRSPGRGISNPGDAAWNRASGGQGGREARGPDPQGQGGQVWPGFEQGRFRRWSP